MKRRLTIAVSFLVVGGALCLAATGCGGSAVKAARTPVAEVSAVGGQAPPPVWLSDFIASIVAKVGDQHPRLVQWALTTNGALLGSAYATPGSPPGDPTAHVYVVAMVGDFTSDGRGHPTSGMDAGTASAPRLTLFYIFDPATHTLLNRTVNSSPHPHALTGLAGAHDLTVGWSTPES